jgi:hypothetical protein
MNSNFLENFDQWYEHYSEASPQAQHQLVLEVISEPIPLDFAVKQDITSILIDVEGLLTGNNLIDQALAFTKIFQQQQPELYQQEFYYFDNFPIRVALFKRELDAMDAALVRYQQEPIKSIDSLLPMLDDLRFYDARAQAVKVSRAVYTPVSTSSKLLEGSEDGLGAVIIADLLEQAYQQIQQGDPVDWEAWGQEAASFTFENTPELRQEIAQNLAGQVLSGPELIALFQKQPHRLFPPLSLRFNMQMADQHQLSFVCSQSIWSAVMSFLDERELSKKQFSHPDHFFSINAKDLDRHVGGLIGGFLSFYQAKGFAILWGIPYVYDFLRSTGIVKESVYDSAIKVATDLQQVLLQHWQGPLWRYSFIHRWGKPVHQTTADFEAEAKRFADSFYDSEPLGTEPSEKPDWEAKIADLAEKAAQKIAFDRETEKKSLSEQELAEPPAPVKPFKTPKPRKSPLKEAEALAKKSKESKKRKKGKGF